MPKLKNQEPNKKLNDDTPKTIILSKIDTDDSKLMSPRTACDLFSPKFNKFYMLVKNKCSDKPTNKPKP